MNKDSNPKYWDDYTNLQRVKHELIREYLGGWFPKLGYWNGRIVYLDTHAGRGRHKTGDLGSPLVALETFINHRGRDEILARCEVRFIFIEIDPDNAEILRKGIEEYGCLPNGVVTHINCENCFTQLEALLGSLEQRSQKIAPAFVFIDPYGFKVPGSIVNKLLNAGRVEIFMNIMWRELDMAMRQALTRDANGLKETLNLIFDGDTWIDVASLQSIDDRADATVNLLRSLYDAKWATSMSMRGSNNTTRYILVHFTNHEAGRDLMKTCFWKIRPDGAFYVSRSDNPDQILLIEPEPDLTKLEEWLTDKLSKGPCRWSELSSALRNELWREPQLNNIIRMRCKNKSIIASDYEGRFSQKSDPLLSLSE